MYRSAVILLILASTLQPGAMAAARVYKTTDADGNVVYTDVPPLENSGRDKTAIEIREVNTYESADPAGNKTGGRVPWIVDEAGDEGEPEFVPYATLTIVAPANDAPLRENSGTVGVEVTIDPALDSRHQLRLLLDGNPVATGDTTSFTLPNVDRGTHTLVVQIIGEEETVLQASPASTFHLQRYRPPPKKPAKTAP